MRLPKALNLEIGEHVRRRDFRVPIEYVEKGLIPVDAEGWSEDSETTSTLITIAVDLGNVEAVRRLMELGADVNQRTCYGSLLVSASALGNVEIVNLLLKAGADIRRTNDYEDDSGETALIAAAATGKLELVRCLLEAGADPKAVTAGRITAIHGAALIGNKEMIEFLLESGCPVGPLDLHVPVVRRDLEVVRLLLQSKPNVNAGFVHESMPPGIKESDTPMHLAVARSVKDPIPRRRGLLGSVPKVPIDLAPIRQKRLAIIDALIGAGADANRVRPCSGDTPLTIAVADGELEIASRLLSAGADACKEVVVRGKSVTALTLAREARDPQLIELLAKPS